MKSVNKTFFKRIWQLTRAYWFSREKWSARGLLAVIISLTLAHVYILVLLNQWNNTFYNTLQNRQEDAFFQALGQFGILATCYILVAVYELYLRQMLQNKWRRWITEEYLGKWLNNKTYHFLELTDSKADNPDQRISEDLKLFVTLTIQLGLGLLKASVTLISFIFILWQLSGTIEVFGVTIYGYMVWVAIVYAIVGTWLTAKIGRPLIGLNFAQQRYEADFRFGLVRIRENSEGVAFYSGEAQEGQVLKKRFQHVFDNFKALMKCQKKLTWFTSGYSQIAIIFPFIVAAPRYFSNQIQLGGLIQISSAFGRVQDALSFFVDSYSVLAEWRAVVNRLTGFIDHMEEVQNLQKESIVAIAEEKRSGVQVAKLNVTLPSGEKLLKDLGLTLKTKESLLIMGPSGCGKSTLLRTLAGIWPFGNGQIAFPEQPKVLFLPQKPYLPLGTLREAFFYPGKGEGMEEKLQEVMKLCQLEAFSDKLDKVENWSHLLSLGEQQRITFARALLQQPDWLFLDEATSALDEPSEQALYGLLRRKLVNTALVSVGHRGTLRQFHQAKLTIQPDGAWQLTEIA